MKLLESVRLVQFFMFEQQELRFEEVSAIYGPNGSGKSAIIDAIQIAMTGANQRMVALNAQADEDKSTRSIFGYCLGQFGETSEDRVRDVATTYITLTWRDTVSTAPLSMGVCLYADGNENKHRVLGLYILPGLELALSDHLERGTNEVKPLPWDVFRHNLIQRAKATSNDNPIYPDPTRYVQAALLALRGSEGAPNYQAFVKAFPFALKMKYQHSVDHIVRHDIFEARPTNIKRFKEVTDSFSRLKEMVARVEKKILDGEAVNNCFVAAAEAATHASTWSAIGKDVMCLIANTMIDNAYRAKQAIAQEASAAQEAFARTQQEKDHASAEAVHVRSLLEAHAGHRDHGAAQAAIMQDTERAEQKGAALKNQLSELHQNLFRIARSPVLDQPEQGVALLESITALGDVAASPTNVSREQLRRAFDQAKKAANVVSTAVFQKSAQYEIRRKEAESALRAAKDALARVNVGKRELLPQVQALLSALREHGLDPLPVCDLVKIRDADWQPVVEAYLGLHLQALLLPAADEEKAFAIYRELTGTNTPYNVNLVRESRFSSSSPVEAGTVAALINGERHAAVAYLRSQFGKMRCATTAHEAVHGQHTLTKDGMLSGKTFNRLRRVLPDHFQIGAGQPTQKHAAINRERDCATELADAKKQYELAHMLFSVLREIPTLQSVLDNWDAQHVANSRVTALAKSMRENADSAYAAMVEEERSWSDQAKRLEAETLKLMGTTTALSTKLQQAENIETQALANGREAQEAATGARAAPDFDGDFHAKHWDTLLQDGAEDHSAMAQRCQEKFSESNRRRDRASSEGLSQLGTFLAEHREHAEAETRSDWRLARIWLQTTLGRLRETDLLNYREQMEEAYRTSQQTFRNDVAIALDENMTHLEKSVDRLNSVLRTCPVFTNHERYQFQAKLRPELVPLRKIIQDVAAGGGELDEAADNLFRELLDAKVAPGSAGAPNPLDDYREFYAFDVKILREDPQTKALSSFGHLSSRIGAGSGGEHRAPLYVIAGAALSSAYLLDHGNKDGIRLMMLDEAFLRMDPNNIIATMRYLEELGLQVILASAGENQGTLNAFVGRYFDIMRDPIVNAVVIEGHSMSAEIRHKNRLDLPEFFPNLIDEQMLRNHRSNSNPSSGWAA